MMDEISHSSARAVALGASLGALLGVAEACGLLWMGTLGFGSPRAALSFVMLSATIYSILGLAAALVAQILPFLLKFSALHPRSRSVLAIIPSLLTFYTVCILGHYYLEFPLHSPAFLLTLVVAALTSSLLWWSLHRAKSLAANRARWLRKLLLLAAPVTILALLTAALFSLPTAAPRPAPVQPNNVVLLTLDTLRADRLGAHGYAAAKTPHLDQLARSGALFRQAYTPVVLTGPAHAALLTSGYPVDHRLKNNGLRIGSKLPTLAEIFQRAGYRTFAAVSVVHLDGHYSSLDRGFQRFTNSSRLSPLMALSVLRITNTLLERTDLPSLWIPVRGGALAVDDFAAWLADHHDDTFFAWIHIYDVHFPYGTGKAEKSLSERLRPEVMEGTAVPNDSRVEQLGLLYDRGVSAADSQVGRVLGTLAKFDLLSNTLVVVASDHGETLANPLVARRYWFHHADVYEDTARVALMISFPGRIPPGLVIDSPVSLLDVAPTTLSLMGINPRSERFRGVDLRPLLDGRSAAENSCLVIQHAPNSKLDSWAARQGCWKLVLRSPTGPAELYNICQDPGEGVDLVARFPERASQLESCLHAHRRFFEVPGAHSAPLRSLVNNLRSLGYL